MAKAHATLANRRINSTKVSKSKRETEIGSKIENISAGCTIEFVSRTYSKCHIDCVLCKSVLKERQCASRTLSSSNITFFNGLSVFAVERPNR